MKRARRIYIWGKSQVIPILFYMTAVSEYSAVLRRNGVAKSWNPTLSFFARDLGCLEVDGRFQRLN
jgi:hypothetical protein